MSIDQVDLNFITHNQIKFRVKACYKEEKTESFRVWEMCEIIFDMQTRRDTQM